jgi:hypothetical protein
LYFDIPFAARIFDKSFHMVSDQPTACKLPLRSRLIEVWVVLPHYKADPLN